MRNAGTQAAESLTKHDNVRMCVGVLFVAARCVLQVYYRNHKR